MSVHVCVHIVSMFVCSQVSIMGNPLVTTQVTLVTVSCQLVEKIFFLKIVFCSSISSWSIVERLNKRLPVASDSPGVTDSYDAAIDSMDI